MAATTTPDKLTPTDPRVQHRTYTIPASPYNKTYHYLLAEPPSGTPATATCLLVHGFPDLSFGWRYQVPYLVSLGLRVIVPDLPGFGRTDAPQELGAYSYKSVIDDLVAIVRHVQGKKDGEDVEKILLGGHDWGGAVVWRFALWYPEVLRCVFSVCTPFLPVNETFYSKEQIVQMLPNFGYQLQFEGTEVEEAVVGREMIRAFLSVMYGARRADGEAVFGVAKGLRKELLEPEKIGESPLVSREEMDFYADEYVKNGMRGPLCWYKTNRVNFDEDRVLLEQGKTKVTVPSLMVVASRDAALPPAMSAGMGEYVPDLVKREVDATHWALWEAPAETNKHIGEFLEGILKGQPLKASI
ncbi:Alpha/Beta hydrolase protein [Parachaetomium inaequale]|uniref:Alpha/Beta hydrolase protein n=1 Tax=Parachaetomium inaequale TaxID=2588326 RepID=A0AAN6SVP6_9PEZI|nr:Alpha/Beta hydrolase protein [Parachaetomium inaequale]